MDYHSNQRAFKAAQARYDAMEPPDDDGPEPEDVDPEFHLYVCPECKAEYGEDSGIDEYTMVLGDDVYCTECLVDGSHPQCDLEVDMDKLKKHMEDERGEAVAEYGEAHVRRCERRN